MCLAAVNCAAGQEGGCRALTVCVADLQLARDVERWGIQLGSTASVRYTKSGQGALRVPKMLTNIDLFAGAGGLSTGLQLSGFHCVFANELSAAYAETLKCSHPNSEVETGDIRQVDAADVRRRLGMSVGELDLLAGGPPCQGFSINAPVRSLDDDRNHLFRDYLRFAAEFRPKLILIENVPGMISFEGGQTVLEIISALRQLEYSADVRVLYAPHYGVPQMRWRTIVLANRLGVDPLIQFPVPSHKAFGRANFTTKLQGQRVIFEEGKLSELELLPFVNVWDAISDLPQIENGGGASAMKYQLPAASKYQHTLRQGAKTLYNHQAARLGEINLKRSKYIPAGGSWRDIPFDLLPEGMKRARRSDHTKRYGRLHPSQLGSTVLTKCDPHWGTYIHPTQDRVISVREAARIQSFPDTIRFMGSVTEQYEQVGNAVPPMFAASIGERQRQILDLYEKNKDVSDLLPSPWLKEQLSLSV
jgi:DNA (cytosine-5)-methyltransferase 1